MRKKILKKNGFKFIIEYERYDSYTKSIINKIINDDILEVGDIFVEEFGIKNSKDFSFVIIRIKKEAI